MLAEPAVLVDASCLALIAGTGLLLGSALLPRGGESVFFGAPSGAVR